MWYAEQIKPRGVYTLTNNMGGRGMELAVCGIQAQGEARLQYVENSPFLIDRNRAVKPKYPFVTGTTHCHAHEYTAYHLSAVGDRVDGGGGSSARGRPTTGLCMHCLPHGIWRHDLE